MGDEAPGEASAERLPQQREPAEVAVRDGGGCLDLDADDASVVGFEQYVDLWPLAVSRVKHRRSRLAVWELLAQLGQDEGFEEAARWIGVDVACPGWSRTHGAIGLSGRCRGAQVWAPSRRVLPGCSTRRGCVAGGRASRGGPGTAAGSSRGGQIGGRAWLSSRSRNGAQTADGADGAAAPGASVARCRERVGSGRPSRSSGKRIDHLGESQHDDRGNADADRRVTSRVGSVGPKTIAMLFKNCVEAAERRAGLR
jgi:hypothetical protein